MSETANISWGVHEAHCPAVPTDSPQYVVAGPCECRADRLCWKCGERVAYDGWDHVHDSGLGIGACRSDSGK